MKVFITGVLFLLPLVQSFGQISIVREICPGPNSPVYYQHFTSFNDYLYYNVTAGSCGYDGLHRTDGTAIGSNLITGRAFDFAPSSRCVSGGHLYYGHGSSLRRINGISGEDELVKDDLPFGFYPRYMVDLNGVLIFSLNGTNLWRSDGTEEGTYLVAEIPGHIFTPVSDGSYVYFATSNGANGLWRSDGTIAGTVQYNLNTPNSVTNVFPTSLTAWNGTVFCIYDYNGPGAGHTGLAKIEGGELVTLAMTGCHPDCGGGCTVCNGFVSTQMLFPTASGVYFFGDSAPHLTGGGRFNEVWKTDGTSGGTYKVATIAEGAISVAAYFRAAHAGAISPKGYKDIFFFPAEGAETGTELWRSDGTAGGTFLVKDIFPGAESSNPREMSVVGGICYFIANDGEHGNEVWRSDGTPEGTYLVMDLNPGSGSGALVGALNEASVNMDYWAFGHNGRYYFNGYTPDTGVELYATGGNNPPPTALAHFTQNLGWCANCEKQVFQIEDAHDRRQYMAYTSGDAITASAARYTLHWEGARWIGQHGEKSPGNDWSPHATFTTNGLTTSPRPPCTGWSHGFSLSGDCAVPSVTLSVPENAPQMDVSAIVTTGVVGGKNAYDIPVTDGEANDKVAVRWNTALLRWEMVLESANASARMAGETVLSYNGTDTGLNPPCGGWSEGYGLSGDICTSSDALPVTLLSFSATLTDSKNEVRLNWSTASEDNAWYYGLERSRDAKEFEEIARITAAGNSTETTTYIHTDVAPLRGRSYYRLRQVDLDGSHTFSKIISVRTSGTDAPYPNPARGGIIRIEAAGKTPLKLTDLSGRDIAFIAKRVNDEVTEIHPAQSLQPGVYIVTHNGVGYRVVVEP